MTDKTTNYFKDIKVPGYLRISRIIAYAMYAWVIFGIAMLGFRVFLLAFSANLSAPFAQFVYKTSTDYLEPFRGIFAAKPIGENGYLDIAAIFAIIIYLFVAWIFSSLITLVQHKIDTTVEYQKESLDLKLSTGLPKTRKKV